MINIKSTKNDKYDMFIMFGQTAREAQRALEIMLFNKGGTSLVKLITLIGISRYGKSTPSDIADFIQTERHNITTLIRRMEAEGLIKVQKRARNRKYKDVSITDKGRKEIERSLPILQTGIDLIMSDTESFNLLKSTKLLRKIRDNSNWIFQSIKEQRNAEV